MLSKISCDDYAASVAKIKELQGSLYKVNKQINNFIPSGNETSDVLKKTSLNDLKLKLQSLLSKLKTDLSNQSIDYIA